MATKDSASKKAGAAKSNSKSTGKTVKVTLVKSIIGTRPTHRATVRGLGLRRMNSSVELQDTPQVRGMINKIYYLVKCEG
jgi:large subunit ribosomal protein L30